MKTISDYLQSKATGRNVLIALGLLLAIGLSFNLIFTPIYQQAAAGFAPFDVQFPLTREMIIIQLGAAGENTFAAYLPFAILDMPFPIIAGTFTALFWAWLIAKAGSASLRGAYQRGWWIWAFFPVACDLAENYAFLSILHAHPEPLIDMIDFAVVVHRGKFVFVAISQGVTLVLMVATLVMWLRRRKPN